MSTTNLAADVKESINHDDHDFMRDLYRQSRKSLPKDAQNLYETSHDPLLELNKKADIQAILK